jgi:hypothetical protein
MDKNLIKIFHSVNYTKFIEGKGDIKGCFIKSKGLGRYCVAVVELEEITNIDEVVNILRKKISKLTNAYWLVREVGVFLIIKVNKKLKLQVDLNNLVDKTGFHSAIIQWSLYY